MIGVAFLQDRRGGVALIAAAAGGLMCALAAITVDMGSLALAGRTLQGVADLAALSAAQDVAHAQAAAKATADANLANAAVVVTPGRYAADAKVRPEARFAATNVQPNAVRVAVTQASPLYFGKWILGKDSLSLTRTATAAIRVDPPRAMFSIGSRLASVDGGIANGLLTGLTGSNVSLTAMDYAALTNARVNLLGFSNALATELGVKAGDYQTLLTKQIDAGRALRVLQGLNGDQGDLALGKLTGPAAGVTVRIGDLIGAEAGAEDGLAQGLDASVGVMDLVMAMLETGGSRQVRLDLGARTGIAALDVKVAIGERPNKSPWLTVTGKGAPIVRTAQARLYLKARTSQKLSGLAQVDLPVLIELASSEARLDAIGCDPKAVTLGVRPGVAKATVGQINEATLDDFTRPLAPTPATLMSVAGLVEVTGSAEIEAADTGFTAVRFSETDIRDAVTKTVTSRSLAQGLIVSLFERLDVNVRVIGLGLGLGGMAQATGTLLTPLGPVLDAAINPVLEALGLKFGQADVRVHAAACPLTDPRPALVG